MVSWIQAGLMMSLLPLKKKKTMKKNFKKINLDLLTVNKGTTSQSE